ncbi:MAG: (E)-4-hydroxy-3-methylbut-2-enyl-diphosphate synthase, partial [Bacteroidales bacterium]|nr:(E)-4-hydroxy-3-methylbut-2-enyl-diphosphate synthase [Bacteroidales bacterium]
TRVSSSCRGLGDVYKIQIQSMTNTDTLDVRATVEQIKRLVEAGCALVRVTTPAFKHVEALAAIKDTLHKEGCPVPLVADVHFLPEVAVQAARIVEKVRINPGNYVDKPTGQATFTAADHEAARRRMAERLDPLLEVCRANGTAIRLGVNHGSLSERMLKSAPDVPQAMVASAMEFIEVCEAQDFRKLVLSMKSSSVRQMREAVLLAVEAMRSRGCVYPLHLGVTEAGNGLDGRLISAVGIGGLLKAGIGDTIRVSLTEAPEKEIPVAQAIVRWAEAFAEPQDGAGAEQAPAPDWARIPAADVPVAAAVAYADRLLRGDESLSLPGAALSEAERQRLLDDLYQAAESRFYKARFVACPSCGRTQYDIEEVLGRVKRRFAGYKGFTIAVMGCIVNGPGEMADADYGYIGCGGGRVNLYRKGQLVEQGIPEADALDALERLIGQEHPHIQA